MANTTVKNAASRAVRSRKARKAFETTYGYYTNDIVRAITRGLSTQDIAALGYNSRSVAAVRANLTRGTYAPFVHVTVGGGFTGTCNFR